MHTHIYIHNWLLFKVNFYLMTMEKSKNLNDLNMYILWTKLIYFCTTSYTLFKNLVANFTSHLYLFFGVACSILKCAKSISFHMSFCKYVIICNIFKQWSIWDEHLIDWLAFDWCLGFMMKLGLGDPAALLTTQTLAKSSYSVIFILKIIHD